MCVQSPYIIRLLDIFLKKITNFFLILSNNHLDLKKIVLQINLDREQTFRCWQVDSRNLHFFLNLFPNQLVERRYELIPD